MPKLGFHKASGQYMVSLTIAGKRKCFYLGKDKEHAESEYYRLLLLAKEEKKKPVNPQDGGLMLFADLADKYLAGVQHCVSPTTFEDYKGALSVVCGFFQNVRVSELALPEISRLKDYLLRERIPSLRTKIGISNNRLNRYILCINMVLNWGLRNGYLQKYDVNLPKIRREPVVRRPPRFFSREEIEKIFACEKNYSSLCCRKDLLVSTIPQTLAMIRFMLATGRRVQEVVHLKKDDLHFNGDGGWYEVTKDKTFRTNPKPKIYFFNEVSLAAIRPLADLRKSGEYIFQNQDGGFLTPRAAGQRFTRILKMSGISNAATKELRHSFASYMLMCGESLEAVRDHLGHTDVKTTQVYAHLNDAYLHNSIKNKQFNEFLKNTTVTTGG